MKKEVNREMTEKKKIKEIVESRFIVVIRIAGEVKIKSDIVDTLDRIRLRKKYSCVLIRPDNESLMGMLKKVKYYVAYGDIDKETLTRLLEARGKREDKKKFDSSEVAEELIKGKTLSELGFKPFFRLHPPRKGIKSKLQYPKGVLGNHKENINKLVERML